MFCGEAEQPQTFISETSYVKIVFYAENYTDQVCEFKSHVRGMPPLCVCVYVRLCVCAFVCLCACE